MGRWASLQWMVCGERDRRKVKPSHRFIMEELVEQPEEVALNRHVRKRLRKAMDQLPAEVKKGVDVAEVFSPPRVVPVGKQRGLNPGPKVDWDKAITLLNASVEDMDEVAASMWTTVCL